MEQKKTSSPGKETRAPFWARRWYIVGAAAFVIGFGLAAAVWALLPKGQSINGDEMQAVYMVNGQMYFGKLQNTDGTYLYMKSPYMPDSNTAGSSDAGSASALVRVKNQLWGPEDTIAIRADQVAFWQNLRSDSKVTQAIKAKQDQ